VGRNPSGRFVLTGALRLTCDQACRRNHAALSGVILIEYGCVRGIEFCTSVAVSLLTMFVCVSVGLLGDDSYILACVTH